MIVVYFYLKLQKISFHHVMCIPKQQIIITITVALNLFAGKFTNIPILTNDY